MYKNEQIDALKRDVRIQQVLEAKCQPVVAKGRTITGKCPKCGTDGGLKVQVAKNTATCFHCDQSGKTSTYNPLSLLHHALGMEFKEAVEWLADAGGVVLEKEGKGKAPFDSAQGDKAKKPKAPIRQVMHPNGVAGLTTYRDRMLRESGIADADQQSEILVDDKRQRVVIDRYVAGTFDQSYEVSGTGDDVVMRYIGLDRRAMTYQDKRGKRRDMVRVRWQNPALHVNQHGKPIKYQSPKSSASALWLPDAVIKAYENGSEITTLYVQEGEKKADRAVKAGLISVGIMGIHNLVPKDNPMPPEFEMIIQRCRVQTVVFVLDADWQELGHSDGPKDAIDKRPFIFWLAVVRFQQHMKAFAHIGLDLNVYFGHVVPNDRKAKGIDDLLQCGLCTDAELLDDSRRGLAGQSTQWLRLYNITTHNAEGLKSHWHIQSPQAFADHYRAELRDRKQFRIGKLDYRWAENGRDVELAQPLTDEEQFWSEHEDKRSHEPIYRFDQRGFKFFLDNRGFSRYDSPGGMVVIREEGGILEVREPLHVKDFVTSWLEQVHHENRPLFNMVYRTAKVNFSADILSNLRVTEPMILRNGPDLQHFVFSTGVWRITQEGVAVTPFNSLGGKVWKEHVKDFAATVLPPMVSLLAIDDAFIASRPQAERKFWEERKGAFVPDMTEDALKCDFNAFMRCSSDFHYEKQLAGEPLTLGEQFENEQHYLAKLTALGHLLHRYRDARNEYAVMAIEGEMIEGNRSEGGTGKSMLAEAAKQLLSTVFINGKKENLTQDQFLFGEVTERTDLVVVDDLRRDFDLQYFFPHITGEFTVRPLGKQSFSIPRHTAPKLYLSSNFFPHMAGSSYERRLRLVAYSRFFNAERTPMDYFGKLFFSDEWDYEQWNLFYNLCACAVQCYFRAGGVIQANDGRLERRRMRQEVGETLMEFLDEYFKPASKAGEHGKNMDLEPGLRIEKLTVHAEMTKTKKHLSNMGTTAFKRKLWLWALLKGYTINPHVPYTGKNIKQYTGLTWGGDDKTAGVEYITLISKGGDAAKMVEDEELMF